MSQKLSLADAMDAVERNLNVFCQLAGIKLARPVRVHMDVTTGTASVRHITQADSGNVEVDVYMPAKPVQTILSTVELDRWTGYFVHELCHVFYTDETAWKTAVRERIHVLVNAMEDVRIERRLNDAGVIGNSRETLNALLAWVVSNLPAKYNPNDPRDFAWLMAMRGRMAICGYALPEAAKHEASLSPAMRALSDWALDELALAVSTNDVLNIARKLAFKLKIGEGGKPADQPKGQPGKGKSEGKSEGKASEGEGRQGEAAGEQEGEGEAGDAGETSNAPEASPEAGEGKASEGEGDAGDKGEAGAGAGGADTPFDMDTMRDVELAPETDKDKAESRKLADTGAAYDNASIVEGIRSAQRTAGRALREMPGVTSSVTEYLARLTKAAMRCGTMRQHVARVLKAEENETWARGKMAGRLDRLALNRVGAGITEGVYCKRTISGGYETEIAILVDGSGSMSGAPAWAAAVLSLVIAQAAGQVGVKAEIVQFPGMRCAKATNGNASNRDVLKAIAQMGIHTSGSTPLTESIVKMAARLAYRAPGKRKLLFVVSDGMCDNGPAGVKKACAYAETLDVETVALCIGVPVHAGFKHGVTCDVRNIAAAGLGKLVQVLSREG